MEIDDDGFVIPGDGQHMEGDYGTRENIWG